MKKQLLMFAFAILPCFITTKPTDLELLMHLQQVQAIGKKDLEEIYHQAQQLEQKLGSDFSLISQILYDFFDIAGLTKEHLKIEKVIFYYICSEVKTLSEITELLYTVDDATETNILAEYNMEPFDPLKLKQANKRFSQIVKSLLKKYQSQEDSRTEEEKIDLFYSDNANELNLLLCSHRTLVLLLQDIKNKINELQQA